MNKGFVVRWTNKQVAAMLDDLMMVVPSGTKLVEVGAMLSNKAVSNLIESNYGVSVRASDVRK